MLNVYRPQQYDEFVEKFKPKLTTNDCYTPPKVYEAIKEWAIADNGWQGREVVRPFYPGGDYENYKYPPNCVVIDNPPFSILSQITRFYAERGVDFFLFAPGLIVLNNKSAKSHIVTDARITYENGAKVPTAFLCSQGATIRTAPSLDMAIAEAQKSESKAKPSYKYPEGVVSIGALKYIASKGIEYEEDNVEYVCALESQRQEKKTLFGGGYFVPRQKLAEALQKAEQKAGQKAGQIVWQLSEREQGIIARLESQT